MATGAGRLIALDGQFRTARRGRFLRFFRPGAGLRLAALEIFPKRRSEPGGFRDISGVGLFIHKGRVSRLSGRFKLRLAGAGPLWHTLPRAGRICPAKFDPVRCRSSVVEHSLGKGEVLSSILSGSTIPRSFANFGREDFLRDLPFAVDLQKAKVVREVARRQLTLEFHESGRRR
jgi:hypothetical protein